MQNSLVQNCRIRCWCSLFYLRLEIPFFVIYGPKNQNFQFKLKFGAKNNLNMQNSRVMFTFSIFYCTVRDCTCKYLPFLSKYGQKNQILSAVYSQRRKTSGFSCFNQKISYQQLSFWFPWLSALVCNSKVFVQTVICY